METKNSYVSVQTQEECDKLREFVEDVYKNVYPGTEKYERRQYFIQGILKFEQQVHISKMEDKFNSIRDNIHLKSFYNTKRVHTILVAAGKNPDYERNNNGSFRDYSHVTVFESIINRTDEDDRDSSKASNAMPTTWPNYINLCC